MGFLRFLKEELIKYPIHPRALKKIREFRLEISEGVELIEPLGFLEFLQLEANATLVLTDSGGVQEESCILRVPCVTLRDNTERPETLEVGSNILTGTNKERILGGVKLMLSKDKNWKNPFNQETIEKLNHGELPFEEKELEELFEKALPNMRFKTEVEEANVFIIAVPTPLDKEMKMAELKYVRSAGEMIYPHLRKDNLVILESTVPPGTSEKLLIPILEKSGLKVSEDFYLAHCPERAIPGNTIHEMVHNDRIIGGIDKKSTALARSLYSCFVKGNFYLTTTITAEFVKLMENMFRDINIALANELANKHPRVNILKPGPGVGLFHWRGRSTMECQITFCELLREW